jgi:hypothetical protein
VKPNKTLDAMTTRKVCDVTDDAARDAHGVFYDPQRVLQRIASVCGRAPRDATAYVVDAGAGEVFRFGADDDDMANACASVYGVEVTAPGMLCSYETGETLRRATIPEQAASRAAARTDGGRGVFLVDGVKCYVEDER